jgi:hypothetical protein
MRSYKTLAAARRDARGAPIVRITAGDDVTLIVIPDLMTRIEILTADSPEGPHATVGETGVIAIAAARHRNQPEGGI